MPIDSETQQLSDDSMNLHNLSDKEIEEFLKDMPEGYRQVFMLVVMDGYSHKEVGELLNISTVSSRSQLSRAKKWLQENLNRNKLKLLAGGI